MGFLHLCGAPLSSLEPCTGLGGVLASILPAGLSALPDSELAPCCQVHMDKMLWFETWHKSATNAGTAAGFFPFV